MQGTFAYRVGETAVLAGGAYIGAYGDDGMVFAPVKYADDSGLGLGELITYFVHDNGDGTMDVFYQIRDADPLPAVLTNWKVTLNASTGAEVSAATQITSGVFSRDDQGMLEYAEDLPNGNIAVILADPTIATAKLVITDADGTEIGSSGLVMNGNVFAIRATYDLTVVGDKIFVAWVETDGGAARHTYGQLFNMDGTTSGSKITVSQAASTGFGHLGQVQTETLSNDKIVVTWVEALTSGADADGSSTWFAIYNADGTVNTGPTLINSNTAGNQDKPQLVATESGFIIGFSAFEFSPAFRNEGRLFEFDNAGNVIDSMTTDAFNVGDVELLRIDNNTALFLSYEVEELILPGADGPIDTGTAPPEEEPAKGTEGDDDHVGTEGKDKWKGKAGNDSFEGLGGNDKISGGIGDDELDGGDGRDKISGDDGNDIIRGGAGKDKIKGGDGNDDIDGGEGNDEIAGGKGADVIRGGPGDDILRGNGGIDTFVFYDSDVGTSVIKDFAKGKDILALEMFTSLDDLEAASKNTKKGLKISWEHDDDGVIETGTIFVKGVKVKHLDDISVDFFALL